MPTSVPLIPRETGIYRCLSRLPTPLAWLVLWLAGVVLILIVVGGVAIVWSSVSIASPQTREGRNAPAPFMHTLFCLRYPAECAVRDASPDWVQIGELEKLRQLATVNSEVNREIAPERNTLGLAGEKWLVWPKQGDCNDYAVTKQYELLRRGWPSRVLLLAEVVVPDGEHHLVLVVAMDKGELVLDNLRGNITPWERLPYRWMRIQSPDNPLFWQTRTNWAPG